MAYSNAIFQQKRRVSADDARWRHIARYDRTRSDNGFVADGHAWADHATPSNETASPNVDRTIDVSQSVMGYDEGFEGDIRFGANGDRAARPGDEAACHRYVDRVVQQDTKSALEQPFPEPDGGQPKLSKFIKRSRHRFVPFGWLRRDA